MITDRTDERILYYVKHDALNAYQIWKALFMEADGNGLAYVNIWKRVNRLSNSGVIDSIEKFSLHGGKHYKISKKGRQVVKEHIDELEEILK